MHWHPCRESSLVSVADRLHARHKGYAGQVQLPKLCGTGQFDHHAGTDRCSILSALRDVYAVGWTSLLSWWCTECRSNFDVPKTVELPVSGNEDMMMWVRFVSALGRNQ